MELKAYIKDRGFTLTEFARLADINLSTASRAMNNKVIPSYPTMKAIEKATRGLVTPNDFYAAQ